MTPHAGPRRHPRGASRTGSIPSTAGHLHSSAAQRPARCHPKRCPSPIPSRSTKALLTPWLHGLILCTCPPKACRNFHIHMYAQKKGCCFGAVSTDPADKLGTRRTYTVPDVVMYASLVVCPNPHSVMAVALIGLHSICLHTSGNAMLCSGARVCTNLA